MKELWVIRDEDKILNQTEVQEYYTRGISIKLIYIVILTMDIVSKQISFTLKCT